MEIKVFEDHKALSKAVAEHILSLIKDKPSATIVLTSGDTPRQSYDMLAQISKTEEFKDVLIIGLDEWVGIPAENEGSCQYIVSKHLLNPLGISALNYTFFNATAADLTKECERIDSLIAARGGLDLMLVGVGLNGHIGLNEPGSSFDAGCQITDLAPITVEIGQKYFSTATPLTKGITIGLGHLLKAKEAILMASGLGKAPILQRIQNEEISEELPASVFKLHPNGKIWIDKAAHQEVQNVV